MFSDSQRNVGFLVRNVRSMAGFLEKPDISFDRTINGLQEKCREWQVFLVGESCPETVNISQFDRDGLNTLIILDLNDAASRR